MDAPTRNGIEVPKWKCLQPLEPEGASAMKITTVGIDLAKNLFQVHAVDTEGRAVAQVRLRRAQVLDYFTKLPPCLVGMEACATAHHWESGWAMRFG